jgi:hypothetical protein
MTVQHSSAGSDTPLQAIVQQAIMAHPHFEGSATLAFGLAGAALKAMPSEPQGARVFPVVASKSAVIMPVLLRAWTH